MRHVLILFTVGVVVLVLSFGNPPQSSGKQAGPESETADPGSAPTPTAIISPPVITADLPGSSDQALAPIATQIATDPTVTPELPPIIVQDPTTLLTVVPAAPDPLTLLTAVPAAIAQPGEDRPDRSPTAIPITGVAPSTTPLPQTPKSVVTPPPAAVAPAVVQSPVLAQGFVEFMMDELAWRAVRYEANTPIEARFDERPPGFVLATDGAVVLIDQASAESTRLAIGQATFVQGGTVQQRVSQSLEVVQYLAIELVSAVGADDAPNGEVLYVSEPFVPSPGRHGLVLTRYQLPPDRVISDTGERNLRFVLEGVAVSQAPGGLGEARLAADDGIVFRGMREVSMPAMEQAGGSGIEGSTIIVASIGAATAASTLPPPDVVTGL